MTPCPNTDSQLVKTNPLHSTVIQPSQQRPKNHMIPAYQVTPPLAERLGLSVNHVNPANPPQADQSCLKRTKLLHYFGIRCL